MTISVSMPPQIPVNRGAKKPESKRRRRRFRLPARNALKSVVLLVYFDVFVRAMRWLPGWIARPVRRCVFSLQRVVQRRGLILARSATNLTAVLDAVDSSVTSGVAQSRYLEILQTNAAIVDEMCAGRWTFSTKQLQGREHLDAALSAERGAIVLFYHFGPYRNLVGGLHRCGYPATQHREKHKNFRWAWPSVRRRMQLRTEQEDAAAGADVIYHESDITFLKLARVLRKNRIVLMTGDGFAGQQFVDCEVAEHHVSLPSGFAELAAQSGAAIIPVFAEQVADGQDVLRVYPPIDCATREDVPDCVRACAELLDNYVRESPWAWLTLQHLRRECSNDLQKFVYAGAAISKTEANGATA